MWNTVISVNKITEALDILAEEGESARIVAGATDLILEIERGSRKGITTLVDVTRIPDMAAITLDEDGWIHLGPLVTHNHCVNSKLIREHAFPLAQAAWEVGSPQIRSPNNSAIDEWSPDYSAQRFLPGRASGSDGTKRNVGGYCLSSLKQYSKRYVYQICPAKSTSHLIG